ncbi:MAG: ferrous iron transport protein A [Gammaproteobacteria bacterium]|jgi:Fe2+ transport system protein FeoA|nr:ferrous iron transport protein A [Gammaproteobacteria bacterium]
MLNSSPNQAFPLSLAQRGEKLRISAVLCGHSQNRRLADLGLPIGREIKIIQTISSGRLIIGNGNGRLALGSDCTRSIMVNPIN